MTKHLRWMVWTLVLGSLAGCGQTFGAFLYHINPFPSKKIPALFALTRGPLLILVDDDQDLLTWPLARDLLVEEIARLLREAQVNDNAITKNELRAMRQSDPQFEERSISELGKRCGAEQILWIQIRDFVATKDIETISGAARFTARVKVFDPNASSKFEMRLWPTSREGEYIPVEKSAGQIQKLKRDADIARLLTKELARKVAQLFYEHRTED